MDGRATALRRPVVKIDPDGRCAVVLLYGWKFAVIPLIGVGVGPASGRGSFRSYLVDCPALPSPIRNIAGFELLHGADDPALVVLHEPVQTWAGRHAAAPEAPSKRSAGRRGRWRAAARAAFCVGKGAAGLLQEAAGSARRGVGREETGRTRRSLIH